LGVEDLGRVYEALLEWNLELLRGMCRLRRQKIEVVVLSPWRKVSADSATYGIVVEIMEEEPEEDIAEEEEGEPSGSAKKTKVEWIEGIPLGQFFLPCWSRKKGVWVVLTPHSFVRFLIQETLGLGYRKKSPKENPLPGEI
jgi:hypothetical protein